MDTIDTSNTIADSDEVVDYTTEADVPHHIRISNGISLRELNSGEGIVFSPDIDEVSREEESRKYYDNYTDHVHQLLQESRPFGGEDIVDEDEFLNDFETLRQHMTQVTTDGGVMKRILQEGLRLAGSVPEDGVVKVHYSMYLEAQDEPFDSSLLRGKPEKYYIGGSGQLIAGMEMGIKTMLKGEKSQFLIDPSYAFGMLGCLPRIPGNAKILATVELLDFIEDGRGETILAVSAEERGKKFSFDEVLKAASVEHKSGISAVKNIEYKLAARHNERGIKLLQELTLANDVEQEKMQKLLIRLLLNAAFCYIKLNTPKKACTVCKEALLIEDNVKALFRFGKAKRMLEDYETARSLLIKAQRKKPNDPDIADELRSLEDKLVRDRAVEELVCKNMFGNIKSKRKEKTEEGVYKLFYDELTEFKEEDPEDAEFTLSLKDLSFVQVKAFKQAASDLQLKIQLDDQKGTLSVGKKSTTR